MNEIPRQPRRCSAFAALFMAPLETIISFAHVWGSMPCAAALVQTGIVLIYLGAAVKANQLPADYYSSLQYGTAPYPAGYPQSPQGPNYPRR